MYWLLTKLKGFQGGIKKSGMTCCRLVFESQAYMNMECSVFFVVNISNGYPGYWHPTLYILIQIPCQALLIYLGKKRYALIFTLYYICIQYNENRQDGYPDSKIVAGYLPKLLPGRVPGFNPSRERYLYNFWANIQLNRAEDPFDTLSAEEWQELARLKRKRKTKRYRGIAIVDFIVSLNVKRERFLM